MREKVRANRDREVTYDRIEGRVQRILYRRRESIDWMGDYYRTIGHLSL